MNQKQLMKQKLYMKEVKLLIYFSNKYIYLQLIDIKIKKTITILCTSAIGMNNNIKSAKAIAIEIYKYIKILDIEQIKLDKKNKQYYGKIKEIVNFLKYKNINI